MTRERPGRRCAADQLRGGKIAHWKRSREVGHTSKDHPLLREHRADPVGHADREWVPRLTTRSIYERCSSLSLALWRDRSRASTEVKELAQKRIAHVERKIEELQMIKRALLDLAERCQGDDRPDCPIIDELAGGTD